jgi:hypothetical protein
MRQVVDEKPDYGNDRAATLANAKLEAVDDRSSCSTTSSRAGTTSARYRVSATKR